MSGKENVSTEASVCVCAKTHKQKPRRGKKKSSGESQLRLSERLHFLCANVCFPSAVPPFFLCVTATLKKRKQTFLLMKSNFVSHCMHLGHWREKGREGGGKKKQDVTQHTELGRATFDSDAKSSLKNSDSSFKLKKHGFHKQLLSMLCVLSDQGL